MDAGERIKVVVLVHVVAPGGAEKMAVESVVGLDDERFARVLCAGREHILAGTEEATREMLRRVQEAGVEVLSLRRKSRFAIWSWLPLLRLLRRERIDILHSHLFGSNLWGCLLGRLAGVPVIVCHEHMWSYGGSRFRTLVDRWLIARWSNAFIAVSEAGRRSMIELEGIRQQDVVLLRNGIRPLPAGDPKKVRDELGIGADQPVVLTIGMLRPEKAHEVLIEAAAELVKQSVAGLRVLIAGEGQERAKLEALIAELGLAQVVTMLGNRTDIPDVLAAADIAVCCSDFEGGPLSVMEYMGAELPVIATEVGGLPELVRSESGVLIPPRDPSRLAEEIAGLLTDVERRRRMGKAGKELRDQEYGIDVYIRRLEALYEQLLEAAGSRRSRLRRSSVSN